jgi:hypothetical protein
MPGSLLSFERNAAKRFSASCNRGKPTISKAAEAVPMLASSKAAKSTWLIVPFTSRFP